jgi:hypothetical protein
MARPVGSSVVGALGVLAAERSWWLLAQTTSAHRSVQPPSRGRASSPWSTRPAGTPRGRSPLSSRRCPPIRFRVSGIRLSDRPVSGHLGWSSRGSGARPSAVHPCGVQPCGVCPRRSGRVGLLPCSGGGVGDPGRAGRATVTTGTGGGPGGCRAVDGSIDGPGGRDAGDAGDVAVVGGRWLADPGRRLGAGRGGRACALSDQAGPAGVGSARRGRRRGGHGRRPLREVAAPDAWRPSSAGGLTTVGGRRRA